MKNYKKRYPVIVSILAIVIFQIVTKLIAQTWFFPQNAVFDCAYEILLMLIPFIFVLVFNTGRVYLKKGFFKTLRIGSFMLWTQLVGFLSVVLVALTGEEVNWVAPVQIIYGIIALIGIGFREEALFRGICVDLIGKKYAKDRFGIIFTALVSSIIFGMIHMTNIFYGVTLKSAVIQSLVAMGAGFYLAAVYLRGGSLWAMMLLHTLTDAVSLFAGIFSTDVSQVDIINNLSIANLTPMFLYGGIGLYLLRKEKCAKIIEKFTIKEETD